ncbi:MAG TPA: hypothetical protein VGK94_01930 [Candidatus Polarisedimenticolia bacterium]|jgi:hypothetical protein
MRKPTPLLPFAIACAVIVVTASAPAAAAATGPAAAGFDKLKSLVGTWEGKSPEGEAVTVTYSLIAGGNTLMEQLSHGNMVTMYHVDGDSLLLTHYCMANNEPRMRAKGLSADGKRLEFKFVDAANLAKPTDMHMHSLTLTFQDADHVTQEWVNSTEGKEQPASFPLTRRSAR